MPAAARLTDVKAAVFTGDFRIVVEYFRRIRQNGDFTGAGQEIGHVDAAGYGRLAKSP